ncbi:MAG: mycofactocin biosynthesis peptidyl-dipeptidase MftE [Microthrixaceae bacterium]
MTSAEGDRPAVSLGALSTADVPDDAVLLVPLGSTEQHGPHLPLDTDTRIAVAVARAVASDPAPPLRRGQVLVAPAISVGSSGEHRGFAGTLSIGAEATEAVVRELVRSATAPGGGPFQAVLLLNGHGGNAPATVNAVRTLSAEGRRVAVWAPHFDHGDAHAGFTETSLALHLFAHLVRLDRAQVGDTRPLADLLGRLRSEGVRAVSPNGVLGDPTLANAPEGKALFARLVLSAHGALSDLLHGPQHPAER